MDIFQPVVQTWSSAIKRGSHNSSACQSKLDASRFFRGKLECDFSTVCWSPGSFFPTKATKQTHLRPNQHDRLPCHQGSNLLGLVQELNFQSIQLHHEPRSSNPAIPFVLVFFQNFSVQCTYMNTRTYLI